MSPTAYKNIRAYIKTLNAIITFLSEKGYSAEVTNTYLSTVTGATRHAIGKILRVPPEKYSAAAEKQITYPAGETHAKLIEHFTKLMGHFEKKPAMLDKAIESANRLYNTAVKSEMLIRVRKTFAEGIQTRKEVKPTSKEVLLYKSKLNQLIIKISEAGAQDEMKKPNLADKTGISVNHLNACLNAKPKSWRNDETYLLKKEHHDALMKYLEEIARGLEKKDVSLYDTLKEDFNSISQLYNLHVIPALEDRKGNRISIPKKRAQVENWRDYFKPEDIAGEVRRLEQLRLNTKNPMPARDPFKGLGI